MSTVVNNNPYKEDYYAVWHMNNNVVIPQSRFIEQKIFNAGEHFIGVKDLNGKDSLIRIDDSFLFGINTTYMSNKFDIKWDDRLTDSKTTNLINDFIRSNVPNFKPSFMEMRNIESVYPYKVESGSNSDGIRNTTSSNDNVVVPQSPTVVCR